MNSFIIAGISAFMGFIAGRLILTEETKRINDEVDELVKDANRLLSEAEKNLDEAKKLNGETEANLDRAYNSKSIQLKYLIDKSFDETIPASDRLDASIELARACGVPEDRILKSIDDIDKFFMEWDYA